MPRFRPRQFSSADDLDGMMPSPVIKKHAELAVETVWQPHLKWMRGVFHECTLESGMHLHWSDLRIASELGFPLPETETWFIFNFTISGAWRSTERYRGRAFEYGEVAGQMSVIRRQAAAQYTCLASAAFVHLTAALSARGLRDWLGPVGTDEGAGLRRLRHFMAGDGPPILTLPLSGAARRGVEAVVGCPHHGALRALALEARFTDLVVELIDALGGSAGAARTITGGRRADQDRIHAAAELLQTRLDHPPTLAELARTVGVSDSTLKRGFRQVFGTTAFGFLRAQRMERARQMIASGETTILEAAAFVGYSNPSNFTTAFRQQFGVNPKVFQMTARR